MVKCPKQTRWVNMWYNIHDATLVWITWKTLTHKLFKVFCCYPKYILFLDFRSIKSIYAMVKNSFVCILNYVSGFCAKKHKYTHTKTQFTQHEASLDINSHNSRSINWTLKEFYHNSLTVRYAWIPLIIFYL